MIDGIVYINLAHRHDRKTHILSELEKIRPITDNVHRIDAVLEPLCGHLGCGKSHVKALEFAIEQNWSSVLIVEDDLKLNEDPASLSKKLTEVYDISWDVVLLGLGHHNIAPTTHPYLSKVLSSTCAHGYLVRRHYYPTLLENFRTAVTKMTTELQTHTEICKKEKKPVTKLNYCSAIDQEWFRLQARDTFYVFTPQIGVQQYELYSDNNCSVEHQAAKIKSAS
jgi:hypothetical protein